MSVYIDAGGHLHHDRDATLALTCPHCQVLAHVTPIAVPGYEELVRHQPKSVGTIYRCDACNSAIFLRYPIKQYTNGRIELAAQFEELERVEERFNYTHLPEDVALLFRETLSCYGHGEFNAFASLCRRTIAAAQFSMTEANRLWMVDQLKAAARIADVSSDQLADVQEILFATDGNAATTLPLVDGYLAGVMVELIKDMLYQTYVRRGRLRQAMQVRRFFAAESDNN
jgi:hypothetical protein